MAEPTGDPPYDPLTDIQDLNHWIEQVQSELKRKMEGQIRILGLDKFVDITTKARFADETHVYRFELHLEVKHAKVFVSADRSSHYWSQIAFEMTRRALYPSSVRHEEVQRKIEACIYGLKKNLINHFIIEAPEQRWKLEQALHKIATALVGPETPPWVFSRKRVLEVLLEAGLPYIVEASEEKGEEDDELHLCNNGHRAETHLKSGHVHCFAKDCEHSHYKCAMCVELGA